MMEHHPKGFRPRNHRCLPFTKNNIIQTVEFESYPSGTVITTFMVTEAEDLNIRKSWLLFAALGLIIGIAYTMTSWFLEHPNQTISIRNGSRPGKHYTRRHYRPNYPANRFPVAVGNEFIDEDNTRYRISLDGWNGTMERVIEKKPEKVLPPLSKGAARSGQQSRHRGSLSTALTPTNISAFPG